MCHFCLHSEHASNPNHSQPSVTVSPLNPNDEISILSTRMSRDEDVQNSCFGFVRLFVAFVAPGAFVCACRVLFAVSKIDTVVWMTLTKLKQIFENAHKEQKQWADAQCDARDARARVHHVWLSCNILKQHVSKWIKS